MSKVSEVFSAVYREERWLAGSGEGSAPKPLAPYRDLLERFIRERGVRRVLDLGCGDWQFSRYVDWAGVEYVGMDVVPALIEHHTATYARLGVRFVCGDILHDPLPDADLVIVKDVLAHLPIAMVQAALERLPQFRYALLTHDRRQYELASRRTLWNLRPREIMRPNIDIAVGAYRPIRLRDAPFSLEADEILRMKLWHSNGWHIKETLLWERGDDPLDNA